MSYGFGSRTAVAAAIALATGGQSACAQMPSANPGGQMSNEQTQAQPTNTIGASARSAAGPADGSSSSQRFWYDGDHKRVLRVDPEWIADFRGAKPNLERAGPPTTATTGKRGASLDEGQSPVLRDETGAPRALPGGVIVRLRDADVGDAPRLFAELGLKPVRALDPQQRTWLVESPAGLESLALANRLHETGRFDAATPNWWRPRALK